MSFPERCSLERLLLKIPFPIICKDIPGKCQLTLAIYFDCQSQLHFRLTFVWFSVRDWKAATKLNVALYFLLAGLVYLFWILVAVEMSHHKEISMDNFVEICRSISLVCGGSITSMKIVENYRHRQRITLLIDTINKRVKLARLVASPRRIQESNNLFLFVAWCVFGCFCNAVVFCLSIMAYCVYTGNQYLDIYLPVEVASYSWIWWGQAVYFLWLSIQSFLIVSFMDAMLIDLALQLAFLFRVEYDRLLTLSGTAEVHERTFVEVARVLVELKK